MIKIAALLVLALAGVAGTSASAARAVSPQSSAPATATARIRDDEVRSAALGRTMRYRVLLPQGYRTSGRRYPVLYLLHGLAGDHLSWTTRTKLAAYVAHLPLVIVMPAGENRWYTNAADGGTRSEDYIVTDLTADVVRKYRTVESRDGRFIAGFSMGGYGALKIALKRPAMFSTAASFSGALAATRDGALDRLIGRVEADRLRQIFGPIDARTRRDNDVYAIASATRPADAPYLYLRCGSSDPLIDFNRELAAVLRKSGLPYDFQETPGAHNWDYADRSVRAFLSTLLTSMKPQAGAVTPLTQARR